MSAGMRPVPLVFARKPSLGSWLFGRAPAAKWLSLCALCAAFAAALAVGWKSWELRGQLRAVESEVLSLRSDRGQAERKGRAERQASELSVQQGRAWNQVTRHLNTPWPAILDALEAAAPDAAAVLAIEPDPLRGSVRLQMEARTLDTLLEYVDGLKSSGTFEDVVLLKHETNEQDPTRPMRLSVDARLKRNTPAPPVETGR